MKVGYYITCYVSYLMGKIIFNSSIVDNANMNITHIKTKTRTKHELWSPGDRCFDKGHCCENKL